ncbi:MAG: TIGR04086 family membrane protein [Oscillospiraceae bacterium]|jgi:putative membrane protein (TIGR04086 family)|nr:TIGR04086 family membrane protein [Oscillospiraceae bacterium]MDD7041235.1 TIGR04086 family membrane protein [Oscillospiraceae bacterium]MDY2611568.1 TIGR04086 family membrane protein [Oscillospiraceae bacterium]
MRNNPPKGDLSPVRKWITPVLFGTAIGLLGTAAILMIFALILTLQDIPQGMILPLAVGAMGIGTFLGGYVSARIVGKKGLLCGFLTGLLYYFILTGISLAVMHFSLDASQAVKMGVAFIAACIGGVLGVNGKGRRKA